MAKLKAEFLQHYYDANGIPFRSKLIANFTASAKFGSIAPGLYNFGVTNNFIGGLIKKASGFEVKRSMPTLYKTTLANWLKKNPDNGEGKKMWLFCDEFTNYNDTEIGIKAVQLLRRLGYSVSIPEHIESGRTWLSKGFVRKAKEIANKNVALLRDKVTEDYPLIGIEPSAILTFRDEYVDLADDEIAALRLAKNTYFIDDFIASEIDKGSITRDRFTEEPKKIKLHGHCQQKAMSVLANSVKLLTLPINYTVEVIPSGCCGMAGSFGYEKEHYDVSMKIGELVLFPSVRSAEKDTIIAAPGTSCRHQIKDGTGVKAKHTVEILYEALK
jgi:Fe-S oxidoreductase